MDDFRQRLEDLGYKTTYENGVAKVFTPDDCYGVGSLKPDDSAHLFRSLFYYIADKERSDDG